MRDVVLVRVRAVCGPVFDDSGFVSRCSGLAGHIEIDSGDTSKLGETSPTFETVSQMLKWARKRASIIVIRVALGATPLFWEGSGPVPADTTRLNEIEAERLFSIFKLEYPHKFV